MNAINRRLSSNARPQTSTARLRSTGARLQSSLSRLVVLVSLLLALNGCVREQQQVVEQTPAASPPQAATPAAQTATPPASTDAPPAPAATTTVAAAPPQPAEVEAKLARIFQGAVRTDAPTPRAVTGDFNGDGSEDIAVVVHPNPEQLADINSEYANWILNEPRKVVLPDPSKRVQVLPAQEPVKVEAGDVLVAVIHGFKTDGWRNPDAQQTYLLRHAFGRDLRVRARADAARALATRLRGDVLEEDAGKPAGVVYWTGAKYAWLTAPSH